MIDWALDLELWSIPLKFYVERRFWFPSDGLVICACVLCAIVNSCGTLAQRLVRVFFRVETLTRGYTTALGKIYNTPRPHLVLQSHSMIPESELMAQARRALREERREDAQGFLVNIVIREPGNDEAWLLLAETITDPQRKMECLEKARRIDSRNPATQRAIQALQNEIAQAAFGQAPTPAAEAADAATAETFVPVQPPPKPDLAVPLLEYAETIAHAVIMSIDPTATRTLGLELVHQIGLAARYDQVRARRWAHTAGRDALVKYEKALSTLITNLPQNDPQLVALREQRTRALDLFK